ncbi:uncharacterized protein LOC130873485 [Chionomys nivalis]|uniref:uncharacterized protein LOC130873485 n=1 Tax=Chionomys nivalis TaxID=269649 RepID=UPI0025953B25|nr:uncharacterized protein LOC130873485 [Chionomys nivalis]
MVVETCVPLHEMSVRDPTSSPRNPHTSTPHTPAPLTSALYPTSPPSTPVLYILYPSPLHPAPHPPHHTPHSPTHIPYLTSNSPHPHTPILPHPHTPTPPYSRTPYPCTVPRIPTLYPSPPIPHPASHPLSCILHFTRTPRTPHPTPHIPTPPHPHAPAPLTPTLYPESSPCTPEFHTLYPSPHILHPTP